MELLERLMASDDQDDRMLGAEIVAETPYYEGQSGRDWAKNEGWPGADVEPFTDADREWLASVLSRRLGHEQDPDVVFSMVQAAGRHGLVAASSSVIGHIDDADEDVRAEAAIALGTLAADRPAPEPMVRALLQLASDPVDEVRSWALFALGRATGMPVDTDKTRAIFSENLRHPDEEIQSEAVWALALLGDIECLERALSTSDYDEDLVEAARRAGDPRLHEPLLKLLAKEANLEQSDPETGQHVEAVLRRAIDACRQPGEEER